MASNHSYRTAGHRHYIIRRERGSATTRSGRQKLYRDVGWMWKTEQGLVYTQPRDGGGTKGPYGSLKAAVRDFKEDRA